MPQPPILTEGPYTYNGAFYVYRGLMPPMLKAGASYTQERAYNAHKMASYT